MRYAFGIGILCPTEAGEQHIDWVPEKTDIGSGNAKINCGDAKNMADKSIKITILIWEAL